MGTKIIEAEELLLAALNYVGLFPEPQYEFTDAKKWTFDLAFRKSMLAIEVDGSGPGHQSNWSAKTDCTKRNAAIEMGWRVLVYPAGSVKTEERRLRIVAQIQRIYFAQMDEDEFPFVLEGDWDD